MYRFFSGGLAGWQHMKLNIQWHPPQQPRPQCFTFVNLIWIPNTSTPTQNQMGRHLAINEV
jgi:hypothetical protein